MRRSFLLAFAAILAMVVRVQAATFAVDSSVDEVDAAPGDGACASAAGRCTLRAAVQETTALFGADRIDLPAGSYVLGIPGAGEDLGATGDLDVRDDTGGLDIVGAGAAVTVIDAAGLDRIVHVFTVMPFRISGVTLQHGWVSNGAGGALLSERSGVTVSNVVARNNAAITGGGLYASGGFVVERSIVTGNSAMSGGGGIQAYDDVTVLDSTIAGNTALGAYGGGIFHLASEGGELRVERSTISGNSTPQSGGGIYTAGDRAVLVNATLSGNRADDSGGGVFRAGFYVIDGVPRETGRLLVVNSTVTENHADADADGAGEGGGIASDTDPADPGRDVTLRNSILAGNLDDSPVGARYVIEGSSDCAPGVTAEGRNLIQDVDGCAVTGDVAGVIVLTSAFLGPLEDNGGPTATHALLVGSPAIDAGDPRVPGTGGPACESGDQRGVLRPQPGGCDLGAYELEVGLCASPASGCKAAAPGKSKLRLDRAAGKSPQLQWTWKGATTAVGEFGAPLAGSDYVLCVFDAADGAAGPALTAVIPGGPCTDRPCWKASGKGLRFHNRAATPAGVESMTLKPGGQGKAAIAIKGRGTQLELPALPLASEPRVLVQLIRSDGGPCWEASYGAYRSNTAEGFAATSD